MRKPTKTKKAKARREQVPTDLAPTIRDFDRGAPEWVTERTKANNYGKEEHE